MPAKVYAAPASHPTATVTRALDVKGIAYKTITIVPPLHKVVARLRFGVSTVPAIAFEDGEKVTGSRAILRALEARRPEPALFPADAEGRRAVEEAEEWGDQVLQPLVRRILWYAVSKQPAAQLSFIPPDGLVPPTPRFVAKLAGGAVAWAERRIHGANEAAVRADLTHLPTHLDRVDGWIERGVLGGESPNAADLQIGSSVRLLLTVADLAPLVDARPCGAHARRLFPEDPGAVPRGALPTDALHVLRR